jgi:phosphohistidine phosphatase
MMHVYVMRHGDALSKAEAGVSSDALRPLSEQGVAHARAVSAWLARRRPKGRAAVWTSPLLRALQTATLLAKALECEDRMETTAILTPEGEPEQFFDRLQRCPGGTVLFVVGHQPLLGRIVSSLAFGGAVDGISLAPGGAAWVELPDFPQSLGGVLHGLWRPEFLAE